jgi:L-asparaginase
MAMTQHKPHVTGPLPRVALLTLGGTIAASPPRDGGPAKMGLTADNILAHLPDIAAVANLQVETLFQIGSVDLTFANIAGLARRIAELDAEGIDGVVVTQGTDTMEETSYLLDLLHASDLPVVFTGAMRHTGKPGADGPANLLAAVRVAASTVARGVGVLLVSNDEIHLARNVRKAHATALSTFASLGLGPIGWVAEGRTHVKLVPRDRGPKFAAALAEQAPNVALVTLAMDDSAHLIDAITAGHYAGAVIATMGAGHVPSHLLDAIGALAKRVPTVFVSRTGTGEVHRNSCDFAGSELRLIERGVIPGGSLDPLKARILLRLLLADGASSQQILSIFEE